jgi:hypothetical protein
LEEEEEKNLVCSTPDNGHAIYKAKLHDFCQNKKVGKLLVMQDVLA